MGKKPAASSAGKELAPHCMSDAPWYYGYALPETSLHAGNRDADID